MTDTKIIVRFVSLNFMYSSDLRADVEKSLKDEPY